MTTLKTVHPNVYKNRLLKLADFLEKLPRKKFDYDHWAGRDWEGKCDLSCGTTDCALGWATTMPLFRRLGLRLGFEPNKGPYPQIIYGQCKNHYAATKNIFNLTNDDTNFLFIPWLYRNISTPWLVEYQSDYFAKTFPSGLKLATPKQVARHIINYVEKMYEDRINVKIFG